MDYRGRCDCELCRQARERLKHRHWLHHWVWRATHWRVHRELARAIRDLP